MGDPSKEQEQAIPRTTVYLVSALLSILMIFIAELFLSAELDSKPCRKRRQHRRSHVTVDRSPSPTAIDSVEKAP